MIESLHNMANNILGIGSLKGDINYYSLCIVNPNGYIIKLYNEGDYVVSPVKIKRNNNVEYHLSGGIYYLRCYNDPKVLDDTTKVYYEEIYVSSKDMGMSRTIKI